MNERIKQMMALAGTDTSGKWMSIDNAEKFAELIVRECVAICNDTNDASYLNGVIAGRKIKQHFEVEE